MKGDIQGGPGSPIPRSRLANLSPYVPGKSLEEIRRETGLDPCRIVKLASNENPLGPPPEVLEAVRKEAADIHLYPDGNGSELKKALAAEWGVEPAWITLGNGSSEVIENAALGFLDSGQEALGFEYGFALYEKAARVADREYRVVPMTPDFEYRVDALLQTAKDRVRLVFLANPNNPTGSFLDQAGLRRLLSRIPDHVLVVLDEAYHGYGSGTEDPDGITLLKDLGLRNLLVTRTFSKLYGLAGLRIGAGIAHPDIVDVLERVRSPINVGHLSQVACRVALGCSDHLSRSREMTIRERAAIRERLADLHLGAFGNAGNFLMVETGRPARPLIASMAREGVVVRGLDPYGLDHSFRVTIGTRDQNRRFLDALSRALDS